MVEGCWVDESINVFGEWERGLSAVNDCPGDEERCQGRAMSGLESHTHTHTPSVVRSFAANRHTPPHARAWCDRFGPLSAARASHSSRRGVNKGSGCSLDDEIDRRRGPVRECVPSKRSPLEPPAPPSLYSFHAHSVWHRGRKRAAREQPWQRPRPLFKLDSGPFFLWPPPCCFGLVVLVT